MATASYSSSAPLPPRLLKDFLQDQITPIDVMTITPTPLKTRLVHKATEVFINAVKFQLPAFKSVKRLPHSSILPRSISRRLSRSRKYYCDDDIVKEDSITVKVKDILRWKSFRDLADDQDHCPEPVPWDLAAADSPSCCKTSTETSTSSGRSSWCDSDFTASSWCGTTESSNYETEVKISKKYLHVNTVGSTDLVGTTTGRSTEHPKVELLQEEEEEESYTPVSILDFSFHEDEESVSPFQRSYSNTKRRRFMPKCSCKEIGIQNELEKQLIVDEEANAIEEKARELLECVAGECDIADDIDHHLLLDFFRHELTTTSGDLEKKGGFDGEVYLRRVAKAWLRGEDEDGLMVWEMAGKREVCIREMDRRERWNKFDEERNEMAMEVETRVLNSLLDELLIDLVCHQLTTDHSTGCQNEMKHANIQHQARSSMLGRSY